MSLTVTCPCGVCFEVEETFAGRSVGCPDCQRAVTVPAPQRGPLRTSGFAIGSLVLALLGAFTIIGTLAAIVCGILALVRIARDREHLAGAGFALFGIILGCAFTALTVFAFSRGELFGVGDQIRAQTMAGRVDHGGPLEIVRQPPGFKIVRPNERWGIARADLQRELGNDSTLMLVNTAHDDYVDVSVDQLNGRTLDAYRNSLVESYRHPEAAELIGRRQISDVKVKANRQLATQDGMEMGEVLLDLRVTGQRMTFLIRVVRAVGSGKVFIVRGWSMRRRFPLNEPELRKVIDSFEVLGR
jgi:hypothetical protein